MKTSLLNSSILRSLADVCIFATCIFLFIRCLLAYSIISIRIVLINGRGYLRGLVFIDDCYINVPLDKKYIVGPLTAMYIKDYRTIMSEVQLIFNGLQDLYKSTLHKYISKNQFDKFMESMNKHKIDNFSYYSECSPKGVSFTYDKTDMTKLASLLDKYYIAGKF